MKKYRKSSKGSYSRVKKINADPKQYFLLIRLKTEMECPQWLTFLGKGGLVMVTPIAIIQRFGAVSIIGLILYTIDSFVRCECIKE